MAETTTTTATRFGVVRIHYPAIFAGVIIALALELLLLVLGDAIGLSFINPVSATYMRGLGAGPVLWSLGIPLGCFLIGGFIASMAAGVDRSANGVLHGLLVWGLGALFLAALLAVSAIAATSATTTAVIGAPGHVVPASASWLVFFSTCLSLIGSAFGGYLGTRPLHRSVYAERRFAERVQV